MRLNQLFVEKAVLPLSDKLLHRTVDKHFRFLKESQWWSEADLIEYQNEKLRKLINHAYSHVAYYRDLFRANNIRPSDIRSRDDLYKIPILTKEDIRKNFPDKIVDKNYPKHLTYAHKSSGSTGEPLQYIVSKDAYSFNIACNLRGWYWMGYSLGDRFVKISQYARRAEKRLQDVFLRTRYLSSARLNEETFKRIIGEFEKWQPTIIRSYPDPLFFIAKYMERNRINHIRPKVVTTTGNVLLPSVRNLIEKQFGCKIFDSYRCEGGPNAFESSTHDCYLSSMEYGIAEILADGVEVGPNEEGRFVTTDLHNYALPFIRYDSQDIVVKSKGKSRCGRQHLAIKKINGRDGDILITPAGRYLIVIHFVDYFDKFASIDQFQVRQNRIDQIDILLKVNDSFHTDTYREILNYWQNYIGHDVQVKVEQVDEIELSLSGKRRFLLRDKSISLGAYEACAA